MKRIQKTMSQKVLDVMAMVTAAETVHPHA